MITLTINGTPYLFPEAGEEPPTGEEVAAWAKAITDAVNNFVSDIDILTTSVELYNDVQPIGQNIIGLSFDSAIVQSFAADYSIYRAVLDSNDVIQEEYTECGTIYGSYLRSAGTWSISIVGNNIKGTGITIKILNTGQLIYNSDKKTIPVGGSHVCRILYKANAFAQN